MVSCIIRVKLISHSIKESRESPNSVFQTLIATRKIRIHRRAPSSWNTRLSRDVIAKLSNRIANPQGVYSNKLSFFLTRILDYMAVSHVADTVGRNTHLYHRSECRDWGGSGAAAVVQNFVSQPYYDSS